MQLTRCSYYHSPFKFLFSKIFILSFLLLISFNYVTKGQVNLNKVENAVKQYVADQNLSSTNYSNYEITSYHTSSTSGITHYYLRQQHKGIPIHNAVMSVHLLPNNQVLKINDEFFENVAAKVNTSQPTLDVNAIFKSVSEQMKYSSSKTPALVNNEGGITQKSVYDKGNISTENIPVQLMYQQTQTGELRLCWDLSISEIETSDWWSMRVDALTGEILNKINWTVYCSFGSHEDVCTEAHDHNNYDKKETNSNNYKTAMANTYTVFPIPTESPIHGPQQTISSPADPAASPFGWHDTNGSAGNEFTITRGNNVWAREDANADDSGGFSPDGTASLDFNFTLSPVQPLTNTNNQSAVITNLFYMNNIMHDVSYHYGFDEASGNFQANLYGNGGTGADWVNADAQDGSGTNNATFSSPPDGQRGRMSMFLWNNSVGFVTANSPAPVAGNYSYTPAAFGATNYNVTGNVVIVNDGSAAPTEGCGTLVNTGALNGNIAMIDRGNCEFGAKCLAVENAGAIAAIICNNVAPGTITMAAGAVGNSVTIPAVMLSQADCAIIRTQVPGLNVTIISPTNATTDSSLDNGIIAHEYGHGISIRLTGGRNNSGCLGSIEQMGEGWSDWYGLILTIEPGDSRTDSRPIGVYATSQGLNGGGIRTYPYSTDFNINSHTYLDIANESIPHGVGSVWCAMLWEMTWDLIDTYGFDTDFYNGTGGNNIALNLVTEALKLQPCNPGFVDGRDAILAADQAIYNGEYNCLIRKAFARRGLGDNASQGSSNSETDGSEDFNAACDLNSCATVDLSIQFDGFPGQTSWQIADASGTVVAASPNYGGQPGSSSLTTSPACLPDGCYTLTFNDAINNGMCPFQSSVSSTSTFITPGTLITPGSVVGTFSLVTVPGLCGNYSLTDGNGTVLASGGGSFGASESNQFCLNGGVAPKYANPSLEGATSKLINTTLKIKPNLVENELNISYSASKDASVVNISILDLSGKIIQQAPTTDRFSNTLKLDVTHLTSGIYFVQMLTSNEIITEKFIKN